MEHIHRALRPKPGSSAPPRDAICSLVDYKLKEDLMRKAREKDRMLHDNPEIELYQDLSPLTLQQRRALRPLLDSLRARGATYRWGFPFSLTATRNGRTAQLQVPEDLLLFCDQMGIPPIALPEWSKILEIPQYPSTGREYQMRPPKLPQRSKWY